MAKKFLDYDGLEEVVAQIKAGYQPTITLTGSKAVQTDSSGKLEASSVTNTELSYLSGVTSAIQTQLNNKQASLTAGDNITIQTINGVLTISAAGGVEQITEDTDLWTLDPGVYFGDLYYMCYKSQSPLTNQLGSYGLLVVSPGSTVNRRDCFLVNESGTMFKFVSETDADFPDIITWSDLSSISNKLNKVNSNYSIYATNNSGSQTTLTYGQTATANYIVQRITGGQITVPATPTNTNDATSKGYVDTGLSGKQDTITGGATTITSDNLTASRALVSDSNGKVAVSDVTSTEIGYLDGVTSAIQTQLNGKQDTLSATNKLDVDYIDATFGTAASCNTGTSQGNVPILGANGKLASSIIPASAITDTFVVSSQAAMLALSSAEVGDVAVRTDVNKSFILKAEPYSTLANWQELLTPTDAVLSVNGQTGAVSLSASDVGAEPSFSKNTAFNKNFETSTTNIKMNGSVSLGSSSNIARADHVHPSDTSRLPTYATDSNSWDTAPTANSTKPVTSGGIKTALDGKEDTMTAITTTEIDNLFNS